jgi:hypothetical protein
MVYPVHAAYAAAVDALDTKVRFVDCGLMKLDHAGIRQIIESNRPDEIVWVSDREAQFEGPHLVFSPPPFELPVFPVLDRWQADHYFLRYAPGARPWQLQIHSLPLGAWWFDAYVRDLRNRFPAYSSAVVFCLERCEYQTEAIESLAKLGMPWSCAAGPLLLARVGELRAAGCVGFIVDTDTTETAAVIAAKLLGMIVHGMGTQAQRTLELPVDSFSLVPTTTEAA